MTASDTRSGNRLDRWSGGCLVAAGLLLLSTAPHPDVFDTTFADAALHTPFWRRCTPRWSCP